MTAQSSRRAVPGPRGSQAATVLASLARNPLQGYVRLSGPVGRIVSARRAAADGRALGNGAGGGRTAGSPAGGPAGGPAVDAPGDLLDVLLEARAQDGSPLTDAEIADEVATFLLAGHETTANTLSWSLALLSAYPPARQRLETVLVLATLARRYRLDLTVRGFPVPRANITLRPGRTLPMRLLRRG